LRHRDEPLHEGLEREASNVSKAIFCAFTIIREYIGLSQRYGTA